MAADDPLAGLLERANAYVKVAISCGTRTDRPMNVVRIVEDLVAALQARSDADGALRSALADPTAVHANMLRGSIAKPSPRSIWHIYGEDLLKEAPEDLLQKLRGGS